MHIALKKQKQHHRYNQKDDIQQKWHPLMLFENNGFLQKWYLANTPSEMGKYDTPTKMAPYKSGTPC